MSSPVWHPFTQHALAPDPVMVAGAEGAWLETPDGRRILDAISSWWVVTHGHRHPRIIAAIKAQADALDQVIFAGFTHGPAERLAQMLLSRVNGQEARRGSPPQSSPARGAEGAASAIAATPLSHVFFSDSGSTAVEVALKMALGFWRNTGEPRTRIVALEHAYHGDTIGTMSAGARGVFNAAYEPLLFEVARLPFPAPGREQATLDALDEACREAPVAALIVEPLILGAGGMLIYPPAVLADMRRIACRHGVLMIADEVMTGFGRTGTFLASDQAGIRPDILCLAKGITGGSMPLAATLCSRAIFDAHYSTDRAKTFFHSSSYTANPIACAAAVANLEIWESEPVAARIAALGDRQAERLAPFADDPRFAGVRRQGTITALDLAVGDAGYLAAIGPRLYEGFLERGVLLRPLGNTIYVMPPYSTGADDLDLVYDAIRETVDRLDRAR
jgi:adenosylmethionine-8-amino-7-oxononanoate aminotransferase